ncbi:MAG: hypothetical protein LUG98_06365 [Tannerellaceae bacterium]|nr:hypothetical protein [Tannerellaceae bacterium]
MKRIGIIWLVVFLSSGLSAQNTDEETDRIQIIVSTKDSVWREPGTLYLPGQQEHFYLLDPSNPDLLYILPDLPVSKDFSEYLLMDSTVRILNIDQLPPSVIMKMGLEKVYIEEKLKSFTIYEAQKEELIKLYNSSLHAGVYAVFPNQGQVIISGPGVGSRFSAEDILRRIFWKSERARLRNHKQANAWKFYNMY